MKRQLLVLDAFTNGHEAALRFVRKLGWKRQDYEIIFCGNHQSLLKRLSEGPAFAVVPVRNSIAGEVREVTKKIKELTDFGYSFDQIASLDLQINHCLLAPLHVQKAEELVRVLSHEKAFQQCGNFLAKIRITPEQRSKENSTGNAAKRISRLGPTHKIGAIAPRAAAKAYKLKILAEKIQDEKKNLTTFLLLENKAYIEPVTVGIIGCNGRFGKVLCDFYTKLGCIVIGSDRKIPTEFTNEDVAKRADVVIFAITIKRTEQAIKDILPFTRKDQLLMDITSVKQVSVGTMMNGKAQVVGLHPMFAPEVPFEGQTIVACPSRLTSPRWKTWVVNMLGATGCRIKWSNPLEHDAYMATVQVSPHLSNLASAALIMEMQISTTESLTFTSPFYKVMFSLMGRLLSQDAGLYSSIAMQNQATVHMFERRIAIEQMLLTLIKRKDHEGFQRVFNEVKNHFGKEVAQEANELFTRLIAVTKTLDGRNTVTLEFTSTDNHPGLLERIARVFRRHNVNLAGINSVVLDPQHIQFTLSFEEQRHTENVRRALEEIEGWEKPKVTVKN